MPPPSTEKRILVACDVIVLSGGLLRFERVGALLREWGHEVAFLTLSRGPPSGRTSALPVLSFEEAAAERWDATLLPGAGFPDPTIERLAELRDERFGLRMQHVLGGPFQRDRFVRANGVFQPRVVVFNSLQWPEGSYPNLRAERFHTLVGAVDTELFSPADDRTHPLNDGRFIVGGLANKHPEVLVAALERLPDEVSLRLFGVGDTETVRANTERVEWVGILDGDALPSFYRGVDCVAHMETHAGWANLVAEAMASGVPVVCTEHGTLSLATHDETALVVEPLDPDPLADGLRRLYEDAALCARLSAAARANVSQYTWEAYGRGLLALL